MAPAVLAVLILIWAAPHEKLEPAPSGALFSEKLFFTDAEKSARASAERSATITKEAVRFVSSLMASTYVVALL